MIISGGKRHIRLVLAGFYVIVLCYILVMSFTQIDDDGILGLKEWTRLADRKKMGRIFYNRLSKGTVQAEIVEEDLSKPFNQKVDRLYDLMTNNDIDNRLFVLDTTMTSDKIDIPKYYLDKSLTSKDYPKLQPFDSRFTIAVYYNYLKRSLSKNANEAVSGPFSWYDWLDHSVLNKYLLASNAEKPTCSILAPSTSLKDFVKGQTSTTDSENDFCTSDDMGSDSDDGKFRTGFNVHRYSGERLEQDQAIVLGKSYLYNNAPVPARLIFLSGDGAYNMTVDKNEGLLKSSLVHDYIEDSKSTSISLLKEFDNLKGTCKPDMHKVLDKYEIELTSEMFEYNTEQILEGFETKVSMGKAMSKIEGNYYNSMLYSINEVRNGGPPKYFFEARLKNSISGDHYDWRFFNGVLQKSSLQSLVLHRLTRVWLSFCRKNSINTWVAHGSLLSWYWNGASFPWDFDIDVQMPIMDLHKLSLDFNQSLVVEDAVDGTGRYFLDCGSFITMREKVNGNNNIDARFIDVDTGLYIDITGLALSNTRPPNRYTTGLPKDWEKDRTDFVDVNAELQIYNCRNDHFSNLNEISPLRKSSVEGEVGYIPNKYTNILKVEYNVGTTRRVVDDYIFLPQIRLWIKLDDLFHFIFFTSDWNMFHKFNEYQSRLTDEDTVYEKILQHPNITTEDRDSFEKLSERKRDTRFDRKGLMEKDVKAVFNIPDELFIDLLNNDDIFINYYTTREFTAFHEVELKLSSASKSTRKLVTPSPSFKPMLYDPFLFKVINDNIDFNFEIDKYSSLLDAYEHADT